MGLILLDSRIFNMVLLVTPVDLPRKVTRTMTMHFKPAICGYEVMPAANRS